MFSCFKLTEVTELSSSLMEIRKTRATTIGHTVSAPPNVTPCRMDCPHTSSLFFIISRKISLLKLRHMGLYSAKDNKKLIH